MIQIQFLSLSMYSLILYALFGNFNLCRTSAIDRINHSRGIFNICLLHLYVQCCLRGSMALLYVYREGLEKKSHCAKGISTANIGSVFLAS